MIKQKKNGFTMIELLIVIVILGILSAIGLGSFTSSQQKARDSRRKSDLKSIGVALETYYNDNGGYPLGEVGTGYILGCSEDALEACDVGSSWAETGGATYMVQLPGDPSGGTYFYVSDGSSYQIYARLENNKDRDVPEDSDTKAPMYYSDVAIDACGTGNCNYGRASTNVILGSTDLDS